MSTVYDEALLDAKKIREAAERAARDRIMETITPQIREMINNRILSEQDDLDDDDLEDDDFGSDTDFGDDSLDLDSIVDSMPDVDVGYDDEAAVALADETASGSVVVNAAGDVNVYAGDDGDDGNEFGMMGEAAAGILAKLVNRDFKSSRRIDEKVSMLQKRVRKLHDVMTVLREGRLTSQQRKRLEISFITCVKDAVSLQTEMRSSGRGSQRLQAKLNSTIKEMREMSSKYKKNIFDFLFEGDDADSKKELEEQDEVEADAEVLDAAGDEEELELDVEDEALEGDVDVVAATDALQDLGSALGLDLEIVDEEGGDEDLEDLEGEEDLAQDIEGDAEELDLEEMAFGGMDEADTVYEIDESILRKELSKMRKRRKVREGRKRSPRNKLRRAVREAAEDEADQFGGAEILGDVIEVDEDTLINVLADELGSVAENRRRRPSRRPAARRGRQPGRSAATARAVHEAKTYKKAAGQLKQQLVEMNLFNAKLLYANKLLQNKGLTVKQQRAIVEALDNAKTLREAKLLYKSLSGSLTRRGRSGKNLSEGNSRTLGSSSRSTRSAQPSNSGVETDRWAVLAGINKG